MEEKNRLHEYSLIPENIKSSSKVSLICDIHGPYPVIVIENYRRGKGCPLCNTKKPHKFWNLKNCREDALKHKSRSEWAKKSSAAYSSAQQNHWIDLCCRHMDGYNPSGYWTLKNCKEDALKYKSRSEWAKKSSAAYSIASKNRWIEVCTRHMAQIKNINGYWTLKKCKEDALKYKTRSEWFKKSPAAYSVAQKNAWLNKCSKHMTEIRKLDGYWTLKKCKEDALKYKSRTEWSNKSKTAYTKSSKNKWLEDCCQHMTSTYKPFGYWSLKHCKEDALKYKTKMEWCKDSKSAYQTAYNNNWLNECCQHMKRPPVWNKKNKP